MAFIQYLTFDGVALPMPDSYEVEMADVEADSGGKTEAGTTQRDVVRSGVVTIPVSFSLSPKWVKAMAGFRRKPKIAVEFFNTETLEVKRAEMFEELIPNFTNTFQVFLRLEGGSGQIDTGGCLASISGQGMAAAPAWDGKIVLEETVSAFRVGAGLGVRGFAETVGIETMELVQRQMADSMGRIPVGAFGCPVDLS